MKAIKFLNYIAILLILSLSSCIDETFDFNEVEEGLPAEVTLKIKAEGNTVVSRAALDEAIENRVDNIYLFIFDSSGNIHYRRYYPTSDLQYGGSTSEGTISLNTASLNGARIIGIANITTDSSASIYDITEEELDAITSFSQLEEKMVKMHSNSIERAGVFLMSGYVKDGNSTEVNIPGNSSTYNLILSRLDAKVMFYITVDPDPEDGFSDFSFQPKTWVVKKIPSQSMLMEKETGDYDENDANYFSSSILPFEKVNKDETGRLYTDGSFVFYMPENRKQRKKEINDYFMREEWSGETDTGDKVFENADPNSTYVEITGLLSYKFFDNEESKEKEVSADVRFIVHLGYGTGDVNDYNTNRNTLYTYNIKVRGIDEIVVEVESNEGEIDKRPGYEGDVIYNESGSYVFDSHYDRRLIFMNPANITDGSDIHWSVNTYFSRGVHTVIDGNEIIEENMRDYRWIKFAINKDYGVGDNELVKYPGDQNYNDPYPMNGAIKGKNYDAPSPYYTTETDGRDYPNARLLDIQQLCVRLKQEKEDGINTPIAITVFVFVHLYFKHPITGEENKGRSLWKLTTDKEERTLHLIVEDARFSQDGNSSKVTAQFSFKQRTIQTVYDPDPDREDLETAWGLESVMETGRLSPNGVQNGNSTLNGRQNTLRCILGVNYDTNPNTVYWTDLLGTNDPDNPYLLKGDQTAIRACMLRNRDLNGDNIVQANEIRWYLASIDQLTDIYLGEYALDEQSRLYPRNAADRIDENGISQVRWHYTSSSAKSSSEAWKLWAEEGASRGGIDFETTDKLSYRCVRNLGISLENPEEVPEDLIYVDKTTYPDDYLIDMTNMNPKALRSSPVKAMLPPHDERSDLNRPYAKFFMSKSKPVPPHYGKNGDECGWGRPLFNSEYQTDLVWTGMQSWIYFQTNNPCPEGYRIPNQRELLIMSSRVEKEFWPVYSVTVTWWEGKAFDDPVQHSKVISKTPDKYMCQTSFSLNGDPPYENGLREGFIWNLKDGIFFLQNDRTETGYVIGVKDVY